MIPIVQVLARHTMLTKRGKTYVGLCPFHQEKTPSFHVNAKRGFYHCFRCGASGNAIDALQALEFRTVAQALEELASLEKKPPSPAPKLTIEGTKNKLLLGLDEFRAKLRRRWENRQ